MSKEKLKIVKYKMSIVMPSELNLINAEEQIKLAIRMKNSKFRITEFEDVSVYEVEPGIDDDHKAQECINYLRKNYSIDEVADAMKGDYDE